VYEYDRARGACGRAAACRNGCEGDETERYDKSSKEPQNVRLHVRNVKTPNEISISRPSSDRKYQDERDANTNGNRAQGRRLLHVVRFQ